eukprot:tig00000342_g24203.t1
MSAPSIATTASSEVYAAYTGAAINAVISAVAAFKWYSIYKRNAAVGQYSVRICVARGAFAGGCVDCLGRALCSRTTLDSAKAHLMQFGFASLFGCLSLIALGYAIDHYPQYTAKGLVNSDWSNTMTAANVFSVIASTFVLGYAGTVLLTVGTVLSALIVVGIIIAIALVVYIVFFSGALGTSAWLALFAQVFVLLATVIRMCTAKRETARPFLWVLIIFVGAIFGIAAIALSVSCQLGKTCPVGSYTPLTVALILSIVSVVIYAVGSFPYATAIDKTLVPVYDSYGYTTRV